MPRAISIRSKLVRLITSVSMLVVVLACLFFVVHEWFALRKFAAGEVSALLSVVRDNATAPLSFNDPEDAQELLRSLGNHKAVEFACIYRKDGSLLAEYRRPGYSPAEIPGPVHAWQQIERWNQLAVSAPVVLQGAQIGSLCVVTNRDALIAQAFRSLMVAGLLLLLAVALARVLAGRMQRSISGPVIALAGTAQRISENRDYTLRAEKRSDDEIGVLTESFNQMLQEVERSNSALVESNKTFTRLTENLLGAFLYRHDRSGRFIWVSFSVTKVLGYGPDEFLRHYIEYFTDHPVNEFAKEKKELTLQGIPQSAYEVQVFNKQGERRWLEVAEVPVCDASGRVILVEGFARDVTERRHAAQRESELSDRLSRAERMESLGVLAGGVAHDLNNMLGPVLMMPELIAMDLEQMSCTADSEELRGNIKENLVMIQRSAERGAAVVRDLLTLGRRGGATRQIFDLNRSVSSLWASGELRSLKESAPQVAISLKSYEGRLLVCGSESQMTRSIYNLVRNAVEAIEGPGRVVLSTDLVSLSEPKMLYELIPQGTYATVRVDDTGGGIDPSIMDRIFDPFFTSKTKMQRSGSGLGLSVVHGCTKDHQGYIDVQSTQGVGTAFTLFLPTSTELPTNESQYEMDASLVAKGVEHILVLDDEPGQRFMAKTALGRLGYQVATTGHASEVLALFQSAANAGRPSPFDLVILDVILAEDIDGISVCRDIMKLYPEQKAIIASGHAPEQSGGKAAALGASWLGKPYELRKLAAAVRSKLDEVSPQILG